MTEYNDILKSLWDRPAHELETFVANHTPDSPYRIAALEILNDRRAEKELKQREEEWHRHLVDATRDTLYSYWAALLASNSIIVAIFSTSLFSTGQRDFLTAVLILSSMASSALVIQNFKNHLAIYGLMARAEGRHLSEKERHEDIKESQECKWKTRRNQQICEGVFVIQFVIIAVKVVGRPFLF